MAFDNTLQGGKLDAQIQELLTEINNFGKQWWWMLHRWNVQRCRKGNPENRKRKEKRERNAEEKRTWRNREEIRGKVPKKDRQRKKETNRSPSWTGKATCISEGESKWNGKFDEGSSGVYENQLKESKGDEKKNLQQAIEMLRNELVTIKESTSKREWKIEDIEKAKQELEETFTKNLDKHTKDMEKARKEYEAKEDEKVREEVRKQIEEIPSLPMSVINSVTGLLSSWWNS